MTMINTTNVLTQISSSTVYRDFRILDVTSGKYLRCSKKMYNTTLANNIEKFTLDRLYLPTACKKHFKLYKNKQYSTYKFYILDRPLVLKIETLGTVDNEIYFTFPLTVHIIKKTASNKLLLIGVELAEIQTSLQVLQFVEEDRIFREIKTKGGEKNGIRSEKKQQQLPKSSTPRERVFRYET